MQFNYVNHCNSYYTSIGVLGVIQKLNYKKRGSLSKFFKKLKFEFLKMP